MVESVVGPLRNIHGIFEQRAGAFLVLLIASARTPQRPLLLASGRPLWCEVGAQMIAVDTLVHNFLHRTGMLSRFGAPSIRMERFATGQPRALM